MMRSKVTAALMRLKEIDRKYNIKRNEGNRTQGNVSTDTSLEGTFMGLPVNSKIASNTTEALDVSDIENEHRCKGSPKSISQKQDQSYYKEDHHSSIIKINVSKKSPAVIVEHSAPKGDTDVSLNEQISSINSGSLNKSLDPATPQSTISSRSKTRGEINTLESMVRQENVDESSIATSLSKPSEASAIISEVVRSVRESSTNKSERKVTETEEKTTENNVKELENDTDQGTIEEAIRTNGERSEIISEQTHTVERNYSVSSASSKEKKQKAEYESDTFEQASTSSATSSNVKEHSKENFEVEVSEDTVRSGVKQIMITLHGQPKSNQKSVTEESPVDVSEKDKKIIELVPPKIVKSSSECDIDLDEELSNYVRTTENVEEITPVNLLKLSKQTTPRKHTHRNKKHRKQNENTGSTQKGMESSSEVSDDHEKLTRQKENRKEDQVMGENNSATMKLVEKQKDEAKDELLQEQRGTEISEVQNEVQEDDVQSIPSEKLLREIPKASDVTWTLRSLNRDAIDAIVRRHRFHTIATKDCKKCGTVVKLPTARIETSEWNEGDDSRIGSLDNLKEVSQDQKRRRSVKRSSKSSKIKKSSNRSKIEEKQSRIDWKHASRLRKQAAAALRQQQEREDIRNYLLELEHTRLEYGIGDTTTTSKLAGFKPLEFPKIATFVKQDPEETNLMSKDEFAHIQGRVSSIRQWLKDQYILYRDYSSLARTINAKYIPASLEDAKRTIRQLQKATIKTR